MSFIKSFKGSTKPKSLNYEETIQKYTIYFFFFNVKLIISFNIYYTIYSNRILLCQLCNLSYLYTNEDELNKVIC